jgi:hypothetical protein
MPSSAPCGCHVCKTWRKQFLNKHPDRRTLAVINALAKANAPKGARAARRAGPKPPRHGKGKPCAYRG